MQFLGSLGINSQLLIAQVINFALLVWLLSYFVYKPTIRMIEKNEKELAEGEIRQKNLEEEMRAFSKEKEKETAAIKIRNKKSMEEMGAAAEMIKNRGLEKAAKDSSALVKQTREVLTLEKPRIEKALMREIKSGFGERLKNSLSQSIPRNRRGDFEEILFTSFIEAIKTEFPDNAIPAKEDIRDLRKLAMANKTEYRKKMERRFGTILVEYAVALSARQKNEVGGIINKRIGLKVPVLGRKNDRLGNGFRLEIAGTVIESSLLKIIRDADKK